MSPDDLRKWADRVQSFGHYAGVNAMIDAADAWERDRADARRYRWLRNNPRADVRIINVGKRSCEALDAAIDALEAEE